MYLSADLYLSCVNLNSFIAKTHSYMALEFISFFRALDGNVDLTDLSPSALAEKYSYNQINKKWIVL